ncbi:aspartate--tRNA ligase [Chitinispirillales bacterium ANBcel5]|uniref:aspartate--tRNA ligase n=1 Tax=Cellulosispirillum alkaliphilum TaxID=3039283 RepID=UPI002A55C3F0|nr:aspartate--tRNA ligase [Chitinispirillales bacterium ANBcel5]
MSGLRSWRRTHSCGELNAKEAGEMVSLAGWVHNWRNHGGVIFIDLRDKAGITQLVFNPTSDPQLAKRAAQLRHEFVISVTGEVNLRPAEMANPKMKTGDIEVAVKELTVLNESSTPPLHINDPEQSESEELRLRYRYLDLRRPALQRNILFRHSVSMEARKFLWEQGFSEIETPILMKSTPEGARDFLVPSRTNRGRFYALPQSPQTYKQILMVSGFERYFQVARCFRDEDLRADRQPEFTQIDAELSFIDEQDIYEIFEGLMKTVFSKCLSVDIETPFRKMSYEEAFCTYGSDKPDLRFDLPIHDIAPVFKNSSFKVFSSVLENKGHIAAICSGDSAKFSRKQIDKLTALVAQYGAKGLVWLRVRDDKAVEGPSAKFFTDEEIAALLKTVGAKPGDMIFAVAADKKVCYTSLGQLRLELARVNDLIVPGEYKFVWVNKFPLFEYSDEEQRYTSVHHPFTAPLEEDIELLEGDEYYKARSRAYDLVLNGTEIGGGSIRIHQRALQMKTFELLGIDEARAKEKFGFLIQALSYGAPPHGGIALGLDRLIMLMLELESIREVIPFPKTTAGISPMDNAPDKVSQEQLKELGLSLLEE